MAGLYDLQRMKITLIVFATFLASLLNAANPKGYLQGKGTHKQYTAERVISALKQEIPIIKFTEMELSRVFETLDYSVVDGSRLAPEKGIQFILLSNDRDIQNLLISFEKEKTNRLELLEYISEEHGFSWYLDESSVIVIPTKHKLGRQIKAE